MAAKLTQQQADECKEIFDMFDEDEDGRIAAGELVMALRSLGQNVDEAEEGTQQRLKTHTSPPAISKSKTTNQTCRRRADAASSLRPWNGRRPHAPGMSPNLEPRRASTQLRRQPRLAPTSAASPTKPGSAASRSGGGRAPAGPKGPPRARRWKHSTVKLHRAPPPERTSTSCSNHAGHSPNSKRPRCGSSSRTRAPPRAPASTWPRSWPWRRARRTRACRLRAWRSTWTRSTTTGAG